MSSGKGAMRPFPNYGINAKVKARDLEFRYTPEAAW